jgi:GT2 family glycosyltransferase
VDLEVIVVDNASTDGSVEMVRKDIPHITLIENSENRGYATACNQGIRIARGRYVLVLNSDTLICDSAIEKTVRYADKHPEAAVVGCQVRKNQDKIQMTCFRFPSLLSLFLRASGLATTFRNHRFFGREDMFWWPRDTEKEVDVVSGMFMLVRNEAIRQVGLMDEAYFLYCEETDWCYRFSKAGWKMLFWPGAMIIHIDGGGQSASKNPVRMSVQFQKSLLLFFKKHHGIISYFLARVLLIVHTGLKYIGCATFVLGRSISGKSATCELAEKQKRWSAFKYCAFGCEPK